MILGGNMTVLNKRLLVFISTLAILLFRVTQTGFCAELPSKASPRLKSKIFAANDRDQMPVIITIKDEINQDSLRRHARTTKGKAGRELLKSGLKSHAKQTQNRVLSELRKYHKSHPEEIGEPNPLWITNAIAIEADKAYIAIINEFEEVENISYDEPVQFLRAQSKMYRSCWL